MLALWLARGTAVRVAAALVRARTSTDSRKPGEKGARDCNCASPGCLLPQKNYIYTYIDSNINIDIHINLNIGRNIDLNIDININIDEGITVYIYVYI